jgi:DNA-binding CsgD family transcriptional regulator
MTSARGTFDRKRVEERRRSLVAELSRFAEDAPVAEAARHISSALHDMFGMASAVYRPELTDDGYRLSLCEPTGFTDARMAEKFDAFIQENPGFFSGYNPVHPDQSQRNIVIGDKELADLTSTGLIRDLYERLGIDGLSQMRALVCDGPLLLAWVGGFRARKLRQVEMRILQSLLDPIEERLSYERLLRAGGSASLLEAAMNAIDAPAFVVSEAGVIVHANATGAILLSSARSPTIDRIRSAVEHPSDDIATRVVPAGRAGSTVWLVAFRARAENGARELEHASREWGLTPRETEVLAHVAKGDANKDISAKLKCAVPTVEVHVTAILRKAKVDSRTRLIARFWRGA